MILLDICNTNASILKVIMFFKLILNIIFIVIPIVLIVLSIKDLARNVINGNDKEQNTNNKLIFKRFIAAIIIFAIPWTIKNFMEFLSTLDSAAVSWSACYTNATKEGKVDDKTKRTEYEKILDRYESEYNNQEKDNVDNENDETDDSAELPNYGSGTEGKSCSNIEIYYWWI